jgi:hypothetical protein
MCTVSFVRVNNKVIITSNRDERPERQPLFTPQSAVINNKKIFFPKDPQSGGTWYAVDEFANVVVLLNGAAVKHERRPQYRKSRGLIVLEIISKHSPLAHWNVINLTDIEPFTIILYEKEGLYQLRWNGHIKEKYVLDTNKSHIWSSATLYTDEVRQQREVWFQGFLAAVKEINAGMVKDFHLFTNAEDKENGLVINRAEGPVTLSITQTVIEANKVDFEYTDLIANYNFSKTFISI